MIKCRKVIAFNEDKFVCSSFHIFNFSSCFGEVFTFFKASILREKL